MKAVLKASVRSQLLIGLIFFVLNGSFLACDNEEEDQTQTVTDTDTDEDEEDDQDKEDPTAPEIVSHEFLSQVSPFGFVLRWKGSEDKAVVEIPSELDRISPRFA